MNESLSDEEQRLVTSVITQAHEQSWGIAVGLLLGVGLFAATIWLVLKGGESVGPHLSLLRAYFPGYSVTFLGGCVGFVYMFVIGYGIGRSVVTLYNRLAAKAGRY
jgi:hypothetical protein